MNVEEHGCRNGRSGEELRTDGEQIFRKMLQHKQQLVNQWHRQWDERADISHLASLNRLFL